MAKRINISVPDFLYQRIQDFRDSFNLSKIFQDAVQEAIKRKEEFNKRIKKDVTLEEIVSRLKKEKNQTDEEIQNQGERAALEWAKRAHYRDLITAVQTPVEELIKPGALLYSYFQQISEQPSTLNEQFLKGWNRGIQEFWDQIKEQIQE